MAWCLFSALLIVAAVGLLIYILKVWDTLAQPDPFDLDFEDTQR